MIKRDAGHTLFWLGAWLLLVTVSLWLRPLLPVDETRYASVAWEMWVRGDFLVPYLNGAPYSHKPPLLFWLIQLGWRLFGVNEWWPRVLPALFTLGSLFLTRHFALTLWPDKPGIASLAPIILISSALWSAFVAATMFDMLLTFWVLLTAVGWLRLRQAHWRGGWLFAGVGIGLGILTKGPVILLHVLPLALLAPLWRQTDSLRWRTWYGFILLSVLLGVLLGAGIALAWAIPAALHGGEAYAAAIFWGQTAHRMVDAFAHQRPWWWYLPLLPVVFFPWFLWPTLWRAFMQLDRPFDRGLRYCLSWLLPPFLAFSAISGKQLHYLLPLFPAAALLSARVLDGGIRPEERPSLPLPAVVIIGLGALMIFAPWLAGAALPEWIHRLQPFWGIALICLGIVMFVWLRRRAAQAAVILAGGSLAAALLLSGGICQAGRAAYDLQRTADCVKLLRAQGAPVAYFGTYHGEYGFLGRLTQPIDVLARPDLSTWMARHPQGRIITRSARQPNASDPPPECLQLYRSGWLGIWPVADLRDHPEFLQDL